MLLNCVCGPMLHMVNHWGMIDHSNAISHRCIKSTLVNVVTNGQGGAILLMKVIKLQELKKNRK